MALKQRDPKLKIYVAIGGWTFNDPGPTYHTFSDLAASAPRQKIFMNSLLSFMNTYGFDGVDLDWEYPRDSDRGGRDVDFANFPQFMERLKSSLDSSKKGITITIPASYWYLQHFDIKNLAKSVEFFNVMSYDLHGLWDQDKKWTGSFLNAHTNVTEIDLALDLLWRNDIDPGQVVMGLGFYGRVFTATSKSCMTPGCTFSSGGKKGDCSREVGILLNSEIDIIIKKNSITPQLFRKEAVKVATWGDQWVAYDDEETFKLKSEFAQSRCLGGLMVWAISHDTETSKYNKVLANVALRKIETSGEDALVSVDVSNDQCKWTNCKQPCPKGWVLMPRKDPDARKDENMLDETGCGGDGVHAFCCPPNTQLPTCGWYGHEGGHCTSTCPDNTIEIGSLGIHCKNKQTYQAGCCTYNTKNMRLYNKCEWGTYPNCDDQKDCPNSMELLAYSYSGSGGGQCDWLVNKMGEEYGISSRKYCCDTSNQDTKFESCKTYSYVGPAPTNEPIGFCRSGCPDARIRVAMDEQPIVCGQGAISTCCNVNYIEQTSVENPKLQKFRDAMKDFMEEPVCTNPGPFEDELSLELNSLGALSTDLSVNTSIARQGSTRAKDNGSIKAAELLFMILAKAGTDKMKSELLKIWNAAVCKDFPSLCMPKAAKVIESTKRFKDDGPKAIAHDVICQINHWDALLEYYAGKGDGSRLVDCSSDQCRLQPGGLCDDADDLPADELDGGEDEKSLTGRSHNQHHHHARYHRLAKRAGDRPRRLQIATGVFITYTRRAYDDNASLAANDRARDESIELQDPGDCTNTRLRVVRAQPIDQNDPDRGRTDWDMEHLVDESRLDQFYRNAAAGILPSGTVSRFGRITVSFFRTAQTMPLGINVPPLRGGADHTRLFERVSECFGSRTNRGNFVLINHDINQIKGFLMRFHDPLGRKRWPDLTRDFDKPDSREKVLNRIRNAISVFRYLNRRTAPDVNTRLTNIVNDVETQLRHAQNVYNRDHPDDQTRIADYWREWALDQFEHLTTHTQSWAGDLIKAMRMSWGLK
ncbi:hypothetical protein ACHAPU_010825 [Fusarium lateritium]